MTTLGLILKWANSTWTGGPNYLKNIAMAVSSVRDQLDLKLVYYVFPDQINNLEKYRSILHLGQDIRVFHPDSRMDDLDVFYPYPFSDSFNPPASVENVYWIPDFQHCYYPEFFSEDELKYREDHFSRLAAGKDMVVFSSKAALNDFYRFFTVRCPTYVMRFASSPEPGWFEGDPQEVAKKYSIDSPYLICCNQFWIHKDHQTLFKALAILRDRGIRLNLVCTGPTEDLRNPDYYSNLQKFLEDKGLMDQVKILGFIPRSDQIQLLRGAHYVVQPSLFEGWSTVIEDGRLLGKRIIHSDIPVHFEQASEGSIPFKAGDAYSLSRVLTERAGDFNFKHEDASREHLLKISYENTVRFGRDIVGMANKAVELNRERRAIAPSNLDDKKNFTGKNSYRVKNKQWYDPALAGASTFSEALFDVDTYNKTLEVLNKFDCDDYSKYVRGYIASGVRRFGKNWKYADICTALLTLSRVLNVDSYLEIGVGQGSSMAMVVAGSPRVNIVRFAAWHVDSLDMKRHGPEFAREQLSRFEHSGQLEFINGNYHETLPKYFSANPDKTYDLITVESYSSQDESRQDLFDVLSRLRIGGAIVFNNISNPEFFKVWDEVVASRPEMSCFSFTELGYGVGFAVRMR